MKLDNWTAKILLDIKKNIGGAKDDDFTGDSKPAKAKKPAKDDDDDFT